MGLKSRHKVDPAFSTAGMLDVIFILLIFFIITSKNIPSVIDASLPESKKNHEVIPDLMVTIQKGESGLKYFVNTNEVKIAALKTALEKELSKARLTKGKVHNVVVRADGKVELQDAVEVTSIIAELGAKATFAVNPIQ